MRWLRDEIDLWCEAWGAERRKMLGLAALEPRDRIGPLTSTLGAVREEGEGAAQGTPNQSFPEVYTGTALLVNRAWKAMDPHWRPVMEIHYVYLLDQDGKRLHTKQKARSLNLSIALYWKYLGYGKNYVHSFVTISTQYEREPSKTMESHENRTKTPAARLA